MIRRLNHTRLHLEFLEARRLLSVYADFNGDGFDDLAIGVPGEDSNAGIVHVLYGSASGLTSANSEVWSQDSEFGVLQVPDIKEAGDQFGAALAGGDFDGDGFADLAIGVPGEDIGSATDAGAVNILYGRASGLGFDIKNNKIWHQDVSRVREIAETGDTFGSSLATGDFNNDGYYDLAVGVPGQDVNGKPDAGAFHIFYGAAFGIIPPANQSINQDGPLPYNAVAGSKFGVSLAAGDHNGDGLDDLAIGAPFHDPGVPVGEGTVTVAFGSANGLAQNGEARHAYDAPVGGSLTFIDINGDGDDDVIGGIPLADGHDAFFHENCGSVVVFYHLDQEEFKQEDLGFSNNDDDNFGFAVAAGDFNNDGFGDVAIGTPGEREGVLGQREGAVVIAFGSSSGVNLNNAIEIHQEDIGIGETSENDDEFGSVLSAGDFNGDGRDDLAIGTPLEDIGSATNAGRVYVLYGTSSGFGSGEAWDQNSSGIAGANESNDHFGGGLNANAGRDNSTSRNLAHLVTADVGLDSTVSKLNKRRLSGGRR